MDGLAGVAAHHLRPGVIVGLWEGFFRERDHGALIRYTGPDILQHQSQDLPDLLSSGGQRSFIAAANEQTTISHVTVYTAL